MSQWYISLEWPRKLSLSKLCTFEILILFMAADSMIVEVKQLLIYIRGSSTLKIWNKWFETLLPNSSRLIKTDLYIYYAARLESLTLSLNIGASRPLSQRSRKSQTLISLEKNFLKFDLFKIFLLFFSENKNNFKWSIKKVFNGLFIGIFKWRYIKRGV